MDGSSATTLYDAIGGKKTIAALTRRFYDIMDEAPEAEACRAVHPPDLAGSREKLFDYLTGWLGGPPLYTDKHGHPMLRRRHFGGAIGQAEIEGWLFCFGRALEETVESADLRRIVLEPVTRLAHHMKNSET